MDTSPAAGTPEAPATEKAGTAEPPSSPSTRRSSTRRTTRRAAGTAERPAAESAGEPPGGTAGAAPSETAGPPSTGTVERPAAGSGDSAGSAGEPAAETAGTAEPSSATSTRRGTGKTTRRVAGTSRRRAAGTAAAPAAEAGEPPSTGVSGSSAAEMTGPPTAGPDGPAPAGPTGPSSEEAAAGVGAPHEPDRAVAPPVFQPPQLIFQAPAARKDSVSAGDAQARKAGPADGDEPAGQSQPDEDSTRKRRRRGGRGRSKGTGGEAAAEAAQQPEAGDDTAAPSGGDRAAASAAASPGTGEDSEAGADADAQGDGEAGEAAGRRRRRRRRRGSGADTDQPAPDDPPDTVVHVREPRASSARTDEVQGVKGSTRLEAKKQRRREGRDTGRRRPPIITESEFLARREAVDREMVVRQRGDRTQIAVLEDDILVEHYVDKTSHQSFVGNVYLGKVQNVLPSMEAAFVDIGKGRNAVLYAGEVNFDASGLEGQTRRIESALKSGQSVLVQVTKDPVGHKGARLTSQISLPGRYLVYVPGASMTGISRKLPDTERNRLKQILKKVMPEGAGVIVRTAAEGATEEELSRDVARLSAQWENIERKAKTANAPALLYSEPDLTIRVVRDIFNEDFTKLVVAGDDGWDTVDEYVRYVAPHLADRLSHWQDSQDVFASYRVDEQLAKALERKVWLPSGGSLVIDRTEAMTVVDVNTGKFTGQGGNLEETVTRNNLEAAEEIVRQLRLRDIGGIIVIDFIDMVLESNRELVLRRLLECLARDRTKHQVAEVTSLGLVQMTRKRVGSGLLEAFSVTCECCNGRGLHVSLDPAELAQAEGRRRGDEKPAPARDGKPSSDGKSSSASKSSSDSKIQAPGAAATRSNGNAEEDRPAGGRRRRRKPAASAEAEVTAEPAATKPADGKPADGKPADSKPADSANGHREPAAPQEASSGGGTRRRRASRRPAGPPAALQEEGGQEPAHQEEGGQERAHQQAQAPSAGDTAGV
ncbi:MAG TPA: Rne/Rng family ribonuclease [Streptosporangiaceae bacterium]|nr:Rne/Rng family ribonuclease [Streptosporangiaceae bacterium]